MAAFPFGVDPTAPLGSDSPASGDDILRALKQAVLDFLGATSGTNNYTTARSLLLPDATLNQWPTCVRLTNATGGSVARNDIVQVDTAADSSVVLGNTLCNRAQLVVAAETIANGSAGLFWSTGVVDIVTTGTVARGDYVMKSATTKAAETTGVAQGTATGVPPGAFAVALAAASGNVCRVLLLGNTFGGAGYGCRVYSDAAISILSGVATALTFNQERYDVGALHSTSSNTGRLTSPVAGIYTIWGGATLSTDTDYVDLEIAIRLNGTTGIAEQRTVVAFGSGVQYLFIAAIYRLAATDYVELVVKQTNTSGGAEDVDVQANYSPEFAMHYLGS